MRDPDLHGMSAMAWQSRAEARTEDHAASIVLWVIQGDNFHPFWKWWGLGVVHLRDLPNVPPANKSYPEAEFEMVIAAIDPDHDVDPDVAPFPFMQPLDVVYHFHGLTDKEAADLATMAVASICAGTLSPDQDYRTAWQESLDGEVTKMGGGHGPR